MSDSVGKIFRDKLRRVLIPDFTNKLTWLLAAGGLALIGGPAVFRLVGKISAEVYGVPIEVDFLSEDRSGFGITLCLLAVIQNITYQAKGALSEAYSIKERDRKHEMEKLASQQAHDVLLKSVEADKDLDKRKREHDVEKIAQLNKVFPFEKSCDTLNVAADLGISDSFQEQLEDLANMHHVSYKVYDTDVEEARKKLVKQAIETQSVLWPRLVLDSRSANRYVPFYEQKNNGMHETFYRNRDEMHMSCIALIRAYQNFVQVAQTKTLWGVKA